MKLSVLGAGAIGSMLGGLVKHHAPQVDVTLIVRGAYGQAVIDRGEVVLEGPWPRRAVPVHASSRPEDLADSDFVLLTVKSHATEEALRQAQPYLGNATLISIQNGVNDDLLCSLVAPEQLIMGMTATNMVLDQPGMVRLQLDGATVIGSLPSSSARLEGAAELLQKTGLEIVTHPNVRGVQYNKLAINALGYASCISAANFITEAVCSGPWRQAVGRPLLQECSATFERASIQLDPIPGRPDVNRMKGLFHQLDWPLVGSVIRWVARRRYDQRPIIFSLYQDLKRGKPTEVDFINGHIVRLANQHGADAPYNQLVCTLVHELEQRGPDQFFSQDEVLARFAKL